MKRQEEIIKELTDKEVQKSLIYSQFLLLFIGVFLHFLFQRPLFKIEDFTLSSTYFWLYVVLPFTIVISIDLLIVKMFPESWVDDGGINKRLFQSLSFFQIIYFTLLIAICEEYLFRYVIQGQLGWVVASLIFAFVHVRYLSKFILFLQVVLLSLGLGWIYKETNSLAVMILLHWLIDFTLGLLTKYDWIKETEKGEGNGRSSRKVT